MCWICDKDIVLFYADVRNWSQLLPWNEDRRYRDASIQVTQWNMWRKIRVSLHACSIYSKCTQSRYSLWEGYVLDIFCCCVNGTVSKSALSAFLRWLGWWVWVWRKNWNSYQSTRHILKRISFLPRVLGVRTPQNNPSDFLRPLLCVGSNLKARPVSLDILTVHIWDRPTG